MDTVRLEWCRQFASSRRERLAILKAISTLCIAIALFMWWFVNAWMVLPFAGFEVVGVALAFWYLEQRADDCDSVELSDGKVTVIRHRRHRSQSFVFDRAWLIVEISRDDEDRDRGVRLRQSGCSVELLEFLSAPARRHALYELRFVLRGAG